MKGKWIWIIGGVVLIGGSIGAYFLLRKPRGGDNGQNEIPDEVITPRNTGGGSTGGGGTSYKAPSELNSTDKIKKFQDWMDAQGKPWVQKSNGQWVFLNKGAGYGNYGKSTSTQWNFGDNKEKYLSGKSGKPSNTGSGSTTDSGSNNSGTGTNIGTNLTLLMTRLNKDAELKKDSNGKWYVVTKITSNRGNKFSFVFYDNKKLYVYYPNGNNAYKGNYSDAGRVLKITTDNYGEDKKNLKGTTFSDDNFFANAKKLLL